MQNSHTYWWNSFEFGKAPSSFKHVSPSFKLVWGGTESPSSACTFAFLLKPHFLLRKLGHPRTNRGHDFLKFCASLRFPSLFRLLSVLKLRHGSETIKAGASNHVWRIDDITKWSNWAKTVMYTCLLRDTCKCSSLQMTICISISSWSPLTSCRNFWTKLK